MIKKIIICHPRAGSRFVREYPSGYKSQCQWCGDPGDSNFSLDSPLRLPRLQVRAGGNDTKGRANDNGRRGNNRMFVFAFVLLVATHGLLAHAQTAAPELFITWTASRSSAPPDFQGKIFPGAKSSISASVMLIDNGKAVDLSNETVYWYANNGFIDGGAGVTRVAFGAPSVARNTINLRAQLPSYGENFVVKTIEIPVVVPEAVIDAPFPGGTFSQSPVKVKAYPFFFTVPDLSFLKFLWNVNGTEPTNQEVPGELFINVPAGTANNSSFSVNLSIENPAAFGQTAKKQTGIIFKK